MTDAARSALYVVLEMPHGRAREQMPSVPREGEHINYEDENWIVKMVVWASGPETFPNQDWYPVCLLLPRTP